MMKSKSLGTKSLHGSTTGGRLRQGSSAAGVEEERIKCAEKRHCKIKINDSFILNVAFECGKKILVNVSESCRKNFA